MSVHSHLKIWELVSLGGVKYHSVKLALKWCIFRHEKNYFELILCSSFWSNSDSDPLSTSKWPFESQFFQRFWFSWQKNGQKFSEFNRYLLIFSKNKQTSIFWQFMKYSSKLKFSTFVQNIRTLESFGKFLLIVYCYFYWTCGSGAKIKCTVHVTLPKQPIN